MMRIIILLLYSLFVSGFVWSESIFVRSKWMVDVDTGKVIENPVLFIENDKIIAVGTAASIKIPEGSSIIDLKSAYLLPGLIDAHVHLAWAQQEQSGLAGADDAKKTLLAGFTTVRNPGSTGKADLILRDAIDSGKLDGPRMFVSGAALGAKGGVCDQVFAGEGVVQSEKGAAEAVAKLAKLNVDMIKFCAGGGIIPSEIDVSSKEFEDAVMQAIIVAASKHKLKVAAHAQGPDAIVQSLRGGVHSIEHGGMINDEAARLMKEKGTYLVPTLYRLTWLVENARSTKAPTLERLEKARDAVYQNVRRAIAAGVPIAFGTDATVYPHGLNAREFAVLVDLGMSPLQAIQSATIYAADLIGRTKTIGRLRSGYFADIVGTSSNPLQDIKALERILFVMKGGKVYKQADR